MGLIGGGIENADKYLDLALDSALQEIQKLLPELGSITRRESYGRNRAPFGNSGISNHRYKKYDWRSNSQLRLDAEIEDLWRRIQELVTCKELMRGRGYLGKNGQDLFFVDLEIGSKCANYYPPNSK